jgi:hypothetical protein
MDIRHCTTMGKIPYRSELAMVHHVEAKVVVYNNVFTISMIFTGYITCKHGRCNLKPCVTRGDPYLWK